MNTLSKERLEQLADDNTICKVSWDERIALARELLALRKERESAVPVAYADPQAFINFQTGIARREWMWNSPGDGLIPLYAAPPAQPVVVPDVDKLKEIYSLFCTPTTGSDNAMTAIHKVCRAAMLKQPVSNSPVIPDGWVAVPVKPTKEMLGQIHTITEATCPNCGKLVTVDCEDNVLMSWDDMLAAAPGKEAK